MKKSIRELEIKLTSDSAQIRAEMKKAEEAAAKFDKRMNAIAGGIAGVGAKMAKGLTVVATAAAAVGVALAGIGAVKLVRGLNAAAEQVDLIGKRAKLLGVGVGPLSELKFAADEAGIEFEELGKLVGKAARTVGELLNQGQGSIKIGRMFVAIKDANGQARDILQLLPEIARALESVGSEAEQLFLAEQIFGRAGGERFVQLLRESGTFIQNLGTQTERARRLGVSFTDDQVDKLTEYNDAVGRIGIAWLGVRVKLATQIAPFLTELANKMAGLVAAIPEAVGRIAKQARTALFDAGPGGDAVREMWGNLFDSLGEGARAGVNGVMRVVFVTALNGIGAVLDALAPQARAQFLNWISNVAIDVAQTAAKAAAQMMSFSPVAIAFRSQLLAGVDSVNAFVDSMQQISNQQIAQGGPSAALAVFNSRLSDTGKNARVIAEAWGMLRAEMEAAGKKIFVNADALLQLTELLDKTEVGIIKVTEAAAKAPAATTDGETWLFGNGLKSGFNKLREEIRATDKLGESVIMNLGSGISGDLGDALLDAGTKFRNFGRTISRVMLDATRDITRMLLRFAILQGFTGVVGELPFFGGTGSKPPSPGDPNFVGPMPIGKAKGGVWSEGGIEHRFAKGGVALGPTRFPMATGMIAEAGRPEGYFPLTRIGGDLGVKATQSPVNVQIVDQRSGGAPVDVGRSTGPDGRTVLRVLIRDEVKGGFRSGAFDRDLGDAYGIKRQPTQR